MDKLNIGGREVEMLSIFAATYVHPDGSVGIKVPTFNSYVEKARKEGWLKPALNAGGTYFYFVEDLGKLPAMYGRKPAAKMVHPDQHETVVKDNQRLTVENVQFSEALDYLNDRIEMLQEQLRSALAREAAEQEVRDAMSVFEVA